MSHSPLSELTRERLMRASTASVTTELMALGFRNCHLHGLTALNPGAGRLVGEAFTMRSIPAREDIDVLDIFKDPAHPQRRAIEVAPAGSVLVVDSREQTRAASLGHILATRARVRGLAGIVTDGSVRDAIGFEQLDLPTFSAGASPTTNLAIHHVVDMDLPIACAGVPIFPGDIMMGDRDGVICIPRSVADEVAEKAADREDFEDFILEKIEAGAPLPGTYPPSDEVLDEYRRRTGEAPQ